MAKEVRESNENKHSPHQHKADGSCCGHNHDDSHDLTVSEKTEKKSSSSSKAVMEQKLQQRYMELQMLDSKVKQVQKQIQQVDAQALELVRLAESLGELKDNNGKKEILVPFSSGIFVKATIDLPEDLLVSVGSNVVVKKSVDDTKALVESQAAELEKIKVQLVDDFNSSVLQAQVIEGELIQMSSELR